MVYGTSTIKVEIGLKIGSTIEYIPMGIYNIDDIEKTDYTIKITAFDNMMKFEKNFITNLGNTLTLQQVVNELVRITGVQFTGTLPSYSVKKLEGFSCREVLSYVASLCGGNAVITRDGKFTIVTPKDINYAIGTSNYFDYTREETKYKIGKISCQAGEEVLSKGSLGADSMELEFENPWVTTTILNDIYTKLSGFEYLGYNMKWQGDLALDVGDIVTITDKKGVVRKHPILSQKFTYTGGLTSEISAKGENKNKNEFSSSGSTAKKIERVVTDLAIVNKALIGVAYIDDLTAGNIKFDTASGTIMDLQTLLAKFVSGENGQFLNLTTDNVTISNALIKDVIAKNISVEDLKAGKISTNKFRITSDNGGIEIVGATQQFKDKNNKVRIQIGQDTQGNFNFILRGEDGTTTLIDHTGIKEKAIADNLIKEKMIAENAVGEKQINYSSLVTGLNKDTNTSLIKASKVAIDLTGQSLEVSFNSLKSNVDNIEVGVENLFLNADFRNGKNNWSGSHSASLEVIDNPTSEKLPIPAKKVMKLTGATGQNFGFITQTINCELDTEYTVSFWCYFPDTIPEGVASISAYYSDSGWKGISNVKITERNKWIKKSLTFKSNKSFDNLILALGFSGAETSNKICYCCLAKVEKGNKATDFTLASKDTEEKIEANTTSIKAVQGEISTLIKDTSIVKGDVTTLKDNYTSIKATVDGINTTVASHTTSITNAQNTADSKAKVFTNTPTTPYKVGDIWTSGPSGDIMKCKVARASGNYVASDWEKASKYTDDTTANAIGMRVTTAESSIKQLNNQIALKVEATEVNNIVNNAVNNVQVGGRNLLPETDGVFSSNNYHGNSTITRGQSDPFGGTKAILLTGTSATDSFFRYIYTKILFKQEGNYTLSVWLKANKVGNFQISLNGKSVYKICNLTTEWQKFELTTNIRIINSVNHFVLGGFSSWTDTSFQVYVALPMLEEGTKASSWSPANEDIDGAISSIDSRLKTAELAITKDAIISTVQSTINTAKSEAINSANSSTDNKLKNYSTTTAMNTAITQSASDITSAVSNTYATKTALGETTTRVASVENKVTATAITTTISNAINAGTNSISTTQFVMDKNGLTIKNGALTIKNKANANVLNSDTNGNLTITGDFITSRSGRKAIELIQQSINLYDWEGTTRTNPVGTVFSGRRIINGSTTSIPGFVIANEKNAYLSLAYKNASGSYTDYILLDKDGMAGQGASFPIWVQENMIVNSTLGIRGPSSATYNRMWNSSDKLVTEISTTKSGSGYQIQTTSGSVLFDITAGKSYPLNLGTNTYVFGNFAASGSKNSLQMTKNYGERLINAYETAEYYFGDIGSGIIKDGECIVWVDDILQECINTNVEYHVFTQAYEGKINKIERFRDYFIVFGEDGTEFSWELKAKRVGYENVRLDQPDIAGYLDSSGVFTEEDLKANNSEDILIWELDFKLEELLLKEGE